MAEKSYTSRIYFENRLTLSQPLIGAVFRYFEDVGLTLRFASLAKTGVTHRIRKSQELLSLQESDLTEYDNLGVWFENEEVKADVSLRRIWSESEITDFDIPSHIEVASTNPSFIFKLVGLKSQLDNQFVDTTQLAAERFTTKSLNDIPAEPAERLRSEQKTSLSAVPAVRQQYQAEKKEIVSSKLLPEAEGKKKSSLGKQLALLVGVIALGAYYWQGHSGERQAKVAEKSYASEEGALFKGEDSSVRESTDHPHSEAFGFRLTNVGKGPATNVSFRCGAKSDHGLEADLGTVSANGGMFEVRSVLSLDDQDVLHRHDVECHFMHFLQYDDAAGRHLITFDSVGNAETASSDEGW